MPTLAAVIQEVDLFTPNAFTNDQKTALINRVEGRVLSEVMELFSSQDVAYVTTTAKYKLTGVTDMFDVYKVLRGQIELQKVDARAAFTGYMLTDEADGIYITVYNVDEDCTLTVVTQQRDVKLVYSTDSTDTLLIPVPYDQVYVYFVTAFIFHAMKDYDEYNNNITLYNSEMAAFKAWYDKRKPREPKIYAASTNIF